MMGQDQFQMKWPSLWTLIKEPKWKSRPVLWQISMTIASVFQIWIKLAKTDLHYNKKMSKLHEQCPLLPYFGTGTKSTLHAPSAHYILYLFTVPNMNTRDLWIMIKRCKNQMKNIHNNHILVQKQILLNIHQALMIPHHCTKFEENRSRHFWEITLDGRTDMGYFKIPRWFTVRPCGGSSQ